jgi:4-amino-4-deoxy-L-arabinose transferase-like glycosyltransferase
MELSPKRRWLWWTLLGFGGLLRAALIVLPRPVDDDTDVYAELGRNLLHHGTYGMMSDGEVSPSLFRLPGYPLVLGLLGGHIPLVLVLQSALDLLACVLLALFVRRYVSERAAWWTLGLSATCLFTAVYAASAMTESLSVFAVAAAIWALGRFLDSEAPFAAKHLLRRLLPLAACAVLAMLLRPDGALLTISIALALAWYGVKRAGWRSAIATTAIFGALAAIPLVPWTVRNAVTFHLFQPLAPRHVNDPGERVNLGFYRWLRTWSVEYETTGTVYWHVGSEPILMQDLPPRAFDSPAQKAETASLIARYNQRHDVDQPLDDAFAALAAQRIAAHPLRYYVWVPILRVADMMMRPRVDATDIPSAWQPVRTHPPLLMAAIALGLLNLFYVGAALAGVLRRNIPLAMFLGTYVLLRYLLLGTMENPEPRYTLELYPIVLVCAGVYLSKGSPAERAP